jgi:hypothetical protein
MLNFNEQEIELAIAELIDIGLAEKDDQGRLRALLVVTEAVAAEHLCVTTKTLKEWRRTDCGPRHVRIGRRVRYTQKFLDEFRRENSDLLSRHYVDPYVKSMTKPAMAFREA